MVFPCLKSFTQVSKLDSVLAKAGYTYWDYRGRDKSYNNKFNFGGLYLNVSTYLRTPSSIDIRSSDDSATCNGSLPDSARVFGHPCNIEWMRGRPRCDNDCGEVSAQFKSEE